MKWAVTQTVRRVYCSLGLQMCQSGVLKVSQVVRETLLPCRYHFMYLLADTSHPCIGIAFHTLPSSTRLLLGHHFTLSTCQKISNSSTSYLQSTESPEKPYSPKLKALSFRAHLFKWRKQYPLVPSILYPYYCEMTKRLITFVLVLLAFLAHKSKATPVSNSCKETKCTCPCGVFNIPKKCFPFRQRFCKLKCALKPNARKVGHGREVHSASTQSVVRDSWNCNCGVLPSLIPDYFWSYGYANIKAGSFSSQSVLLWL